jgi:predicted ester cyclase
MIWAAFPDAYVAFDDVFGQGEKVACRFTMRATHRGEFMGVAATNKPITLTGITVLRFSNGACVERWNAADLLGLLQQLGAVPS